MSKKFVILCVAVLLGTMVCEGQVRGMKRSSRSIQGAATSAKPGTPRMATAWVDATMRDMTLRQKVAQLMVIRVPLDLEGKRQRDFEQLLRETEVGGVCFFVGTAKQTLPLVKRFQSLSQVPLLVCIDAEWGLGAAIWAYM